MGNECVHIVVATGNVKIWFPLEGLPDVVNCVGVTAHLHNGQNEIVRFVQRIEHFVAGNGDR